ncbi:MAG: hypothetical protein HC767_15700 [Akkermansiaceae bacterium]|nr:hypothetical protein [Akkermansiaceae bacterium]
MALRRLATAQPAEPLYDPAELHGLVPQDVREPYDAREVIARLARGEFKQVRAHMLPLRATMVCTPESRNKQESQQAHSKE